MVRTGLAGQAVGMAATVTVNDVLDGHVGLDVECLDRIYLNGYVPNLQVGGPGGVVYDPALGLPDPVAGGAVGYQRRQQGRILGAMQRPGPATGRCARRRRTHPRHRRGHPSCRKKIECEDVYASAAGETALRLGPSPSSRHPSR